MRLSTITISVLLLTGCQNLDRLLNGKPSSGPSLSEVKEHKVIIAMGQSNILGRGNNTEFPSHPHVTQTRDLKTGPAYYAAYLLALDHPDWGITVVQCAEGSTRLDPRWMPGGDRYERCIEETKAQDGDLLAIMFYQGESDARYEGQIDPDWPEKFTFSMNYFKAAISQPNIPLIWAQHWGEIL